jgi:hypothetical protein
VACKKGETYLFIMSLTISFPTTIEDTTTFINYVLSVITYHFNIKASEFCMISGIKAYFSLTSYRLVFVMGVGG